VVREVVELQHAVDRAVAAKGKPLLESHVHPMKRLADEAVARQECPVPGNEHRVGQPARAAA
jgi:hypothetical protein